MFLRGANKELTHGIVKNSSKDVFQGLFPRDTNKEPTHGIVQNSLEDIAQESFPRGTNKELTHGIVQSSSKDIAQELQLIFHDKKQNLRFRKYGVVNQTLYTLFLLPDEEAYEKIKPKLMEILKEYSIPEKYNDALELADTMVKLLHLASTKDDTFRLNILSLFKRTLKAKGLILWFSESSRKFFFEEPYGIKIILDRISNEMKNYFKNQFNNRNFDDTDAEADDNYISKFRELRKELRTAKEAQPTTALDNSSNSAQLVMEQSAIHKEEASKLMQDDGYLTKSMESDETKASAENHNSPPEKVIELYAKDCYESD